MLDTICSRLMKEWIFLYQWKTDEPLLKRNITFIGECYLNEFQVKRCADFSMKSDDGKILFFLEGDLFSFPVYVFL